MALFLGHGKADGCRYLELQRMQKGHRGRCMDCVDNGGGHCTEVCILTLLVCTVYSALMQHCSSPAGDQRGVNCCDCVFVIFVCMFVCP